MGEHYAVASGWLDGKASAHAAKAGTRTALEIAAFSDPAAPRTGYSAVLSPANWEFMKPFILGGLACLPARGWQDIVHAPLSGGAGEPGLRCVPRSIAGA